ncbi:MAG: recombinase family protein [Defluviitaleaceae bacterium]|nr:recombinase family protein [Defluviitaleaceae bacterium]
MGKKYGYIRVSTQGQAQNGNGLKSQREAVINRGAEEVFEDVWTGTNRDRPELSKLMDLLKCGDTLIVTKLDRVARSVVDGCTLIETLVNRGVTIDVLDMAVFDSRRTSVLQLHVLLAFAQFERDLLLERLQEGKAVAREKEGYREGRKPKWSANQYNHAMKLLQHNSYKSVSEMTGIPIITLKVERRKRKDAELKAEQKII